MPRRFLSSIDLVRNEIQNAVAQVLAAPPGSPVPGQFYYNSTTGRFEFRGAEAWIDPTARANHTGTQAWATISGTPTTLAGYGITDAQALSAQLNSFAALATNGLVARTAANTIAARSLASTTPAATWTNPDAVAGNPSLAIANAVAAGNAGLMTGADKTKLDGVATGATANATDAALRDRATHTGTQTAATISNFDTQVRTNRLDQMAAPTAAVSLNGQVLTNVATPVSGTDGVNRAYVDNLINGTDWKNSVRVATTENIALSGLLTIDGITLVVGDRVLVKDQTTATQNGIYSAASGAWTRATDADTDAKVTAGMSVMVTEGTVQGDSQWRLTTNDAIVLGTTALAFAQIGAATSFAQGPGITIAGNVISVDTATVSRKFAQTIGDGALTSITITHGLGTLDTLVQVYEVATGETVECDVVRSSTSQVTLGFALAPATNALRVLVQG